MMGELLKQDTQSPLIDIGSHLIKRGENHKNARGNEDQDYYLLVIFVRLSLKVLQVNPIGLVLRHQEWSYRSTNCCSLQATI